MYGSEYAYPIEDSAREHLVPNLRIIASQPWMGLTAYVGDEPHLIVGKEDDTYLMEDQHGQFKLVDFVFPWEEPRVEENRLVAASRIKESPFRTAGVLAYDDETGEWAVRVGTSNMRFPLEEKVASLEAQGWSKYADTEGSGLDLGGQGVSGPATQDHPGAGHGEPTIEVRAACPHCHSDQHLELMTDEHGPHSDEKKYGCHNCGKWSLEHELEVSDHDTKGQDKNPEDVDYEEHDDDADRHQDDHDREREVHDKKDKFEVKKHTSTAFSFQGRPVVRVRGFRRGEAIKPEEQSTEDMLHHVQNLAMPHEQEAEYVQQRYRDMGLGGKPFSYDNPFINRGGGVREAAPEFVMPKTGPPSLPEEFPGGTYILAAKWLTPDHTVMFENPGSEGGIDPRFKGIITMLGGPGSHAVVVAQGADLPCVVASGDDIDRIGVGDHIDLDGETGVVHVNGGDPNFQAQDPNTIQATTEVYRFAYANGNGHVEKMQPGAMTGELGGHGGMSSMLMDSGHAQISPEDFSHNIALGYLCTDGTIIQDSNPIPDEDQFLQWAHAQEERLGLPQGRVKKLDISAYVPRTETVAKVAATFEMPYPGGQGIHNGTSAAFSQAGLTATVTAPGLPQPITLPFSAGNMFIMIKMFQAQGLLAEGQPIQVDSDNPELAQQIIQQQAGVVASVQKTAEILTTKLVYPNGGIHNGTVSVLKQEGIEGRVQYPPEAVAALQGLPGSDVFAQQDGWAPIPGGAMGMQPPGIPGHMMIFMFGKNKGQDPTQWTINLDTNNNALAEQIIHAGGFLKSGASTGEDAPSGGPKRDKALKCPKCGSHTVEALSKDDEKGSAELLCLSCGTTFNDDYRKTSAGKHPNGTRVQLTHPTKKGIKGSIMDHAGTDDNFGDDLYDLQLDNGDKLEKVPEIHFNKIKSASTGILVIAALHDEVAEYAQMLAHATDQDAQEIAADLADKGMIHTDEEWTEVTAIVNHLRGKNPAALAGMQKGAPYPENSYKNSPDHSPKGQDWPAEVNAVYNACMREGNGDKEKCAKIAWSQYEKTKAKKGRGTTEEEGKKKESDYQPNVNPAANPAQQQQTPPCPHCGSPTVGDPTAYRCPNCGYSYPEQQGSTPGAAMGGGTAGGVGAPAPSFHSSVKSAALSVGEWYTMYSPDYKVPDVIQVVDVNDQGVTANIEGDDKGLFPITLPHNEIEQAGYRFEPYNNPAEVKTAKVARRQFTVQEQDSLVNENLDGLARNYHKLNLADTHYPQETEASVDPLNEEFWLW